MRKMNMQYDISENPFLVIPENKSLVYKEKIIEFAEKLKDFVVNDESSNNMILNIYSKARVCEKEIETERKRRGDPLRRELARINDKAKEVSDPLSKIISICNQKSAGYKNLLNEQNEQLQLKIREAEDMFGCITQEFVEPVSKVIRGEGAMSITKVEKKFKLVDIAKVPLKYLMLDEAQLKRDIALGMANIDGIEIYEESKTTLRIR